MGRAPSFDRCYQPFPRQKEFHNSPAKYRLFGGAAGPGKTKALLWEAIMQASEVPGCDTLLLRRTFSELESSLLAYFRRDIPRSFYKSYNESKHLVTWSNGSTTRFGYCRNENDVYQYQGAEFLFIGLDELTHFTLKQWQFLTSRNRCPVRNSRCTMAGATNPGNIGHAWVKDAEYRKTLESLPEHQRRAFLEGDWNVFAGQYFDVFDFGRHTARLEEIRLEPWWPRWVSVDWGFQHPSAVYWHCAAPAENGSRVVTYREFVQNGLSPRMLAQAIAERSGREPVGEVILSPDAFAHRTSEASIAEQLGDVLIANGLPRPAPASDDRVGGWQLMYQMLESNTWLVTDNCAKLIDCLPLLVRDNCRQEDIRKVDGDDPADAARYGLVSGGRLAGVRTAFGLSRAGHAPPLNRSGSPPRFVTGMPLDEQIARQVSATDPSSRAIHFQRLESEAKKQFRPKKLPRRRP
jgi:phage terminase large subunit